MTSEYASIRLQSAPSANETSNFPQTKLKDCFVNAQHFGEDSRYSEVLRGSSGRVSHARVAKVAVSAFGILSGGRNDPCSAPRRAMH